MYPCDLTRSDIQTLIPHRDPFLFLESARITSDNDIAGQAVWIKSHPILQGHFPQKPVVPGVCLIEAGAQLAGVLVHWKNQNLQKIQSGLGVLASIQKAKFKYALMPDEVLTLHCKIRALSPHAYWVQCRGITSEILVFESEILLAQHVSNA